MTRTLLAVALPALAVALVASWLLTPPPRLPARFGTDDCQRVDLVDARARRAVVGVEDLALLPDGATLILSAHDRLDPARPAGRLYLVRLDALPGDGPLAVWPLQSPGRAADGFRPHGLAVAPDGRRLAVVNRVSGGETVVELGPLGPGGWVAEQRIADPRFCRANDVAFTGAALLVTVDRADCGLSARDLAGGTGSVLRLDGGRVSVEQTGLNFPNGIAGGWVAETRGKRLQGKERVLPLPGGPDNLSLSEGRLIAALHPNLLRTGLYIRGWVDRLGSRIVAADPGSGAVEVLYDDPSGRLFSGATAAVLAGARLVAGSVRDAGLLFCRPRGW